MKDRYQRTIDIFDSYERRFAAARAAKEPSCPWQAEDRAYIIEKVKKMLGYREEWVPKVGDPEEVSRQEYGGYCAIQYRYETWPGFYGAATLYLPEGDEPKPLVFLCCGHGNAGRLTGGYMAMGHRLAQLGMAALVMDNIGQGDRNPNPDQFENEHHWLSVAPFYCGTTLQGMIVMETLGVIRRFRQDPRFDPSRLAACGNSGGGTLTLFLAALAPELSVLASSGYPSEFSYLMAKERFHCACNLLPGCAHGPEMWEIYSCFAPKPLLLEGGTYDHLIPLDLAHRNARKVAYSYFRQDAAEQFEFVLEETRHSWELADINRIGGFLAKYLLGKEPAPAEELFAVESIEPFRVPMPPMPGTEELTQRLTGVQMPGGTTLQDIYVPQWKGDPVDPAEILPDLGRGSVMRVFAQMECALQK